MFVLYSYTVYTLQLYLYWKLKVSGLLKQFVVVINKHLVFTETLGVLLQNFCCRVLGYIVNTKGETANIYFKNMAWELINFKNSQYNILWLLVAWNELFQVKDELSQNGNFSLLSKSDSFASVCNLLL